MGLFSTTNHFHTRKNSTSINMPDRIDVHEYKAPTDESIRLMEDAHDRAMKNIIAKVKVENNLVNGECYCFEEPWKVDSIRVFFKFQVNGKEYTIDKSFSRFELSLEDHQQVANICEKVKDYLKGIML